ncbi:hypothetical protein GJAV_G00271650 [Gymnothorax javanicus]|nr:hypothetical protein GJAV_G00271650 [Gymnothorax javanicus]
MSQSGVSVQQQRERWDRKRSRTARELVRTEQKYCLRLELIVTYFVEILRAKGTLKHDIRDAIFSSITSIHSANQEFLAILENGNIGLGFERFCPNLNYYYTYVDNYQKSCKVLQIQLKRNKAFRRFKKLQESRPEFQSAKLEELLQLPLQRIQQYKHFLRDLAENTSPDHQEFPQLSRAVKAISGVSQRIQDNARSHENHLQLQRVQRLLKGRKTKVLAPGRWYIKEGWLKVVPPKGAEAKPKMFFLFSDVLLLTTPCSPLHPTNGDKFACRRVYPLKECAVDKVFGHTRSQGGLISLTFAKDKLLLMSSDQEDMNDWYRSLTSAIGQLMSRNTAVHRRRSVRNALPQHQRTHPKEGGKEGMVTPETLEEPRGDPAGVFSPSGQDPAGASKRMKLSGAAAESPSLLITEHCCRMANTADRELSVDGDGTPVPRSVNLGDAFEQMKVLFSENKELKEAMQRTNDHMKERFEELGAWKEKQKRERDFLEQKLEDAKRHITALSGQNEELHRKVQGSEDQVQVLLQDLNRTLEQVRSELETSKSAKMTLSDRCRELEQEKQQWQAERQQLQAESQKLRAETHQLTVQLQSLQDVRDTELNQAEEQRKRWVELQESFARLSEENQRMKDEMKKQQVSKEEVKGLQTQLKAAEMALADKQVKLDQMKQEFYKKENELDTISVFKAQAEVYAADFQAEREARVQIHEEKERLSKQLELVQQQNTNLKQELDALAQQSLSQVQNRHRVSLGGSPEGGAATWNQPEAKAHADVEIPVHVCPKCDLVQPDLDTLQIHIMDCID